MVTASLLALQPLIACAARAPLSQPVGTSRAESASEPEPKPEQHRARPLPEPSWPDFSAALGWPQAALLKTLGHHRYGAAVRLRVRVAPSALSAYRDLATDSPMPSGAQVAAFHEAPDGELLSVFVLEKGAGGWTALELSARGVRVPSDGALCLRCHVLAPSDYLFGLASRSAEPGSGVGPPAAGPADSPVPPPAARESSRPLLR